MTALHVKYRPATFDDVVGQDNAVKGLRRAIKGGRTHTFLLTGPSGVGKTTLARIAVNEIAKPAIAANLIEVDAATNSGADNMRDVISKTLFRAVGASPIKGIIVDECHRLSAAAWTIMLKPIEEPPEYIYWFFCTTDPGKVPKNILTRCLRNDLKQVDEDSLQELLLRVSDAESFKLDDDILEAIAETSDGSARQALVFLEDCRTAKSVPEAREIMRTTAQMKEPIDLARLLVANNGRSWQAAAKIIKNMENVDAETIRFIVVNYLGTMMANASDDQIQRLLFIYRCFDAPYNPSEKLAPLFLSVGKALGIVL